MNTYSVSVQLGDDHPRVWRVTASAPHVAVNRCLRDFHGPYRPLKLAPNEHTRITIIRYTRRTG